MDDFKSFWRDFRRQRMGLIGLTMLLIAIGVAVFAPVAVGFLLTMVTIQLVPAIAETAGWRWAFPVLAAGPVFGIGAIIGPTLVGFVVSPLGYSGLFLCTATAEALLALYVLAMIGLRRGAPKEEQVNFVSQPPLSHGTQAIVEIQPLDEGTGPDQVKPR